MSTSTSVIAWASRRGGVRDAKQKGFQTEQDDSHGECGSDVFRQTVPDTSSSDWQSSVAHGRQSRGDSRVRLTMLRMIVSVSYKARMSELQCLVSFQNDVAVAVGCSRLHGVTDLSQRCPSRSRWFLHVSFTVEYFVIHHAIN